MTCSTSSRGTRDAFLSYETLLRRVWVGRSGANVRVLRAFVMQLRRKIGDDSADPTYISTCVGSATRCPEPARQNWILPTTGISMPPRRMAD